MNFSVEVTDIADEDVTKSVRGSLVEYNESQTGVSDFNPLSVTLKDSDGEVAGGLIGYTAYGWLFIELLFVPDAYRNHGVGTDLMRRAEEEAARRGCHSAWLDTFEFQAREFYERLGYECFGTLEDYPPGYTRYFMKKLLSSVVPGA